MSRRIRNQQKIASALNDVSAAGEAAVANQSENTQGKKARTIGGVYQDLKRISEQKGVDLGFGDETEESFTRKYNTGRGDEQLYNKLKEVSQKTGLDLGLPDDVLEWKASLIRGDEQGTSKPSLDGVERPAAAGTEVQERKVGTQAVEKSPYEELFRRADERREQRRREAEALKPQESAQEIEARHERLRKAAAISDAVAAIGNVLWTGRGSRQVYDPRQSMSEAAKKRYAERMARYDKQQQAWLRAREAYERGENTIENLRLRAMEYEDRRKAREADAERRAAESKKRQEDIDNRIKWRDTLGEANKDKIGKQADKIESDKEINRKKAWMSYHGSSGGGGRGGGNKDYTQVTVKEDGYGGKTTTTVEKHYGTSQHKSSTQKKSTGVFGKSSGRKSTGVVFKKRPK